MGGVARLHGCRYTKRALDAVDRQLSADAGPTVSNQYSEMVCGGYHLPLLEQCVTLHLSNLDFTAAQQCLLTGTRMINVNPDRFSARRPMWHTLLAAYFDATSEIDAAVRHLSIAATTAVSDDDRLTATLARALLAVRTDTAADTLAMLVESCDTCATRDADVIRQFLSGLQQLCAGELDSAKDLLSTLKQTKLVSKRLSTFVLMITALCCRTSDAADSGLLLARADKSAKSMDDKMLRRCLRRLCADDDTDSAAALVVDGQLSEDEYISAVAMTVASESHLALLSTWGEGSP